ncbi:DUF726-domain-containing protein [Xylariomycetidae sp. FL0641]|nr:DUF726-domain-containing protein [Xylariomycetidae sp. FL0641]
MPSVFDKAKSALRGNDEDAKKQDEEGESLTTVLTTTEERAALTLLICEATEVMRKRLLDTFDPHETGRDASEMLELLSLDDKDENASPDQGSTDPEQQQKRKQKFLEKQRSAFAKRQKEVNDEKMVDLKNAALTFFDDWRDTVILRVGEVVNSKETAEEQEKQSQPTNPGTSTEADPVGAEKSQYDERIDKSLRELYPPIDNPLQEMDSAKRALILHSVLLLLLSLEHYRAHSRTLLLHLTTSLGLSVALLTADETKIAQGLLQAAEVMSAEEETKKRKDENKTSRRIKMGVAGVAGAALIGITGGLAAPFLAAGLGTVLGGLGLGATVTAGYLGALASSGVIVGSLFGAYGARMTSKAMEKYTRDVEDFAFMPIDYHRGRESEGHRLRVAIGISGWLREEPEVVEPWKIIGPGQERFALRWELEALLSLGSSLRMLITSAAWKVAKGEIIKRTVFAALSAGLWPIALTNVGHIIDNPWSVANQRAQKAGEVLADALINKAQGERPVTLIGYSLGAKIIYVCLQQLARRRAFGLIENAIMLGAPTPSDSAEWRGLRSVVSGRVVNAYSTEDYILAYLYRTSSIQYGVAGLRPVADVKGVENVDISDIVEGHTLYRHATGPLLERIGFEDVEPKEAERAKRELQAQGQEEKEQRDAKASSKGSSEQEIKEMEEEQEARPALPPRRKLPSFQ